VLLSCKRAVVSYLVRRVDGARISTSRVWIVGRDGRVVDRRGKLLGSIGTRRSVERRLCVWVIILGGLRVGLVGLGGRRRGV
jgi:hypothetical protein